MKMIVACCRGRGIGFKNTLPWYIPNDLKHFKNITSRGDNNVVVMGKKTWDSLPIKPLKNRKNIILSKTLSQDDIGYEDTFVLSNFEKLDNEVEHLLKKKHSIWLIGGESIFNNYIKHPKLEKIYLTDIHEDFHFDVQFPEIPNHFYLKNESPPNVYKNISYTYKLFQNEKLR